MPYALCLMPYALCLMPYALCLMPYALWQQLYTIHQLMSFQPFSMSISSSHPTGKLQLWPLWFIDELLELLSNVVYGDHAVARC